MKHSLVFLALLSVLVGVSHSRIMMSRIKQQMIETNSCMKSPLLQLFKNQKGLEILLDSSQRDLAEMSLERVKSLNAKSGTIRSEIHSYFDSVCVQFMKDHPRVIKGSSLATIINKGCALLFQNINEGIDSMNHAERLTARVVFMLENFSKKHKSKLKRSSKQVI